MTERFPRIAIDHDIMAPLRAICLAYPEAVEAEAFGTPTFQINRKNFVMVNMLDHRVSIWCKAPPGAQEAFVVSEPEHYFRPPYLGPKGWIGAWVSPETAPDWDAIADIIDESYRLIAPKRLLKLLDSGLADQDVAPTGTRPPSRAS